MRCRENMWCIVPVILCLCFAGACGEDHPLIRIGCQNDRGYREGALLALEEIHKKNHPFQFEVSFDNHVSHAIPHQAVESAQRFGSDPHAVTVIGYASSDASLAAAEIFRQHKMPQIIPTATSTNLQDTSEWTFRLCPGDLQQSEFLVHKALHHFKARHCAVIYQNNDYGRGLARLFSRMLEEKGGKTVFIEPASSGLYAIDLHFLDVYARQINEIHPDLVVFFSLPYQAKLILEAIKRQGKAFSCLGSDSMDTPHVLLPESEIFTGMKMSLYYHETLTNPGNRAFAKSFYRRYGRIPHGGSALVYDTVHLLYQACREGVRTRTEMLRYLRNLGTESPPYQGITGPISFNEERVCPRPIYFAEIKQGRMALIRE